MDIIRLSITGVMIGILCLLIVLLILAIYLIIKRHRELKHRQSVADYIAKVEEKWFSYLTGNAELMNDMLPQSPAEREAIEELFFIYAKNLSNPQIRDRISSFASEHLVPFYKEQLNSLRWSTRLNTLYKIIEFNLLNVMKEELASLMNRKLSKEEHFQLFKNELMKTSGKSFIEKLLTINIRFSEHEYRQLFIKANNEVLEQVMEQFEQLPKYSKWALIDVLGLKREIAGLSFLESLISQEDAELRIKALKAIYRIGVVLELERYLVFIDSPTWEERLMVAKILENVPLEDSIMHLHRLLEDESWWVRSQAAACMGLELDSSSETEGESTVLTDERTHMPTGEITS